MISMLKTLIKFIFYYLINLLVLPSKKIKPNSLLLIRLDAIGDYLMFRNFIQELKESQKYKEFSITLLGNSAWASLSEEIDIEFIDRFIWIDIDKINKNFVYRYKMLKEVSSVGYEVILNSVFSREFFYNDAIVKLVNAKKKIGSAGDISNMRKWQKYISDKYYDRLIKADESLMFEFNRNKEFFENLLHVTLDIKKPHIDLKPKKLPFKLPQKYAILFIGASTSSRMWSIERFSRVGEYLKEKYSYEIVLCGASSDSEDATKFKNNFMGEYIDLVGKTSLVDLLYVINNSNLIISNETSAPHFAAALELAYIFVISNGNHYGRFTPYPKNMSESYHVIYHPEIEKDIEDYEKLSNKYGYGSSLNINEISVESVKNKVDRVLNL
jgi:ADP-heptose:LPS heptosyltransferase